MVMLKNYTILQQTIFKDMKNNSSGELHSTRMPEGHMNDIKNKTYMKL
jgi:hypothetical protein